MKKIIYILLLVVLITGCKEKEVTNDRLKVAVSIVPQQKFVEVVGGDYVEVTTLIPPGYSPANYEPTPKLMEDFSNSKVYFRIGVPAEEITILPNVDLEGIEVVDLPTKVFRVHDKRYFEGGTLDPHIWTSPKRAKVMVREIRDKLIELDPEHKEEYTKNADEYLKKLSDLDEKLTNEIGGGEFIIKHPSLGYFAKDYGMTMISLEHEGKESTAHNLEKIIEHAKENNIKHIFYQSEFSSEQAKIIAEEIDGEVVEIDPLSYDYIENIMKMKDALLK